MWKIALVLGLMSCVGPIAIDIYLPAMPLIAGYFGAAETTVQASLTAFFLAFGICQMVYGPWSDQAGRKIPVYTGLLLFIAGSLGCALAPSLEWLIAARFVQGCGGAVVMVVPRAIIRDLYTGTDATRLMGLVMLVIAISPMLAPLAGSLVVLAFDWQAIFAFLVALGILSLLLAHFALAETLPVHARIQFRPRPLITGTGQLMRDRNFLVLTLIGGLGMASFFVFIASAPFVYARQFGLSPFGFSVAFAINAIGFFTASNLAAPLATHIGFRRVVQLPLFGFAALTASLAALILGGYNSLYLMVGMLFLANMCLGFVMPATMVMALEHHGEIAGLASSLGGTLQMVAGGIAIGVAGLFFDGSALPLACAIALCGTGALVLSRFINIRESAQMHRRQASGS